MRPQTTDSPAVSYGHSRYAVADALAAAHSRFWRRLAGPGSWWTGAERVAIAIEARRARECELCRRRKQSLSPYFVNGEHDRWSIDQMRAQTTDSQAVSYGHSTYPVADALTRRTPGSGAARRPAPGGRRRARRHRDEARRARECDLCRRRKQSSSPYFVSGEHDRASALPEVAVDACTVWSPMPVA